MLRNQGVRHFVTSKLLSKTGQNFRNQTGQNFRNPQQETLAAEAGIHRTHVSFIERGVHVASLEVALKLAGAFEMTLTTLVSKAERKFRNS